MDLRVFPPHCSLSECGLQKSETSTTFQFTHISELLHTNGKMAPNHAPKPNKSSLAHCLFFVIIITHLFCVYRLKKKRFSKTPMPGCKSWRQKLEHWIMMPTLGRLFMWYYPIDLVCVCLHAKWNHAMHYLSDIVLVVAPLNSLDQ